MKTRSASRTDNFKSRIKQQDQTDNSKKQFQGNEKNSLGDMESPIFDSAMNNTKIDADHKTPAAGLNFQMLGLKIRSNVIEIIKVTLLIIAFFIIYKVAGAHDLWIQFLDTFDW